MVFVLFEIHKHTFYKNYGVNEIRLGWRIDNINDKFKQFCE